MTQPLRQVALFSQTSILTLADLLQCSAGIQKQASRDVDPFAVSGGSYSYTGAITEPRQVLRGGYLSWHDPVTDHWWQEQYFGDQPEFMDLGILNGQSSLRAQIERLTNVQSMRSMVKNRG